MKPMPLSDGTAMRARWWTGAAVLVVGMAAIGQAQPPAEGPEPTSQTATATIWLRVTADEVNLRSRPDANSVPVTRAERGTVLQAFGRDDYGWYRVVPPEGVFSYVASEYVDRRGPDEGLVSVRSGTLRVRVGSLIHELDPLQSEVQALLERGTRVQIVGEQGAWLRIAPPAGVSVYVSGNHVETIRAEVAAHLRTPSQPAPARLAADAAPEPETKPASGPDLSGPWGQRLLLVETAIEVEGRKPLLDQSWGELSSRLQPIAAQREEPMVARLARAWIAQLTQRTTEQAVVRDAEEVLRRTARDQAQHERELERIGRAREVASQPVFAARGALLRSYALHGRDGSLWYKLQDPVTKRLAAYVEIDPAFKPDPERLVGQYVGVRGIRRPEPGLGADVVQAEEIVVLERGEPATQPATQASRQGS